MKIDHVSIWVRKLEEMRAFYQDYFQADCNNKYQNPKNNFSSYFLTFESGSRIELMHRPDIFVRSEDRNNLLGLVHIAISVGSKERVLSLTEKIRSDGYDVLSEARITGDGYFESVIQDPEGNIIEICE